MRGLCGAAGGAGALVLLTALAHISQSLTVTNYYTSNIVTIIDGSSVPTPQRVLTITCNAGDTYRLLGTEVEDGEARQKTIDIVCGGSIHSWDIQAVDSVPIMAAVYTADSNIINEGLMEKRADAVMSSIYDRQKLYPDGTLLYLSSNGSVVNVTDQDLGSSGNDSDSSGSGSGDDMDVRQVVDLQTQTKEFFKYLGQALRVTSHPDVVLPGHMQGPSSYIRADYYVDPIFLKNDGTLNCEAISAMAGASQGIQNFGAAALSVGFAFQYSCGYMSNQIDKLTDHAFTSTSIPNVAGTGYAACQQFGNGPGNTGLANCLGAVISVGMSQQQMMDQFSARLDAYGDALTNVLSRISLNEARLSDTAANLMIMSKYMKSVVGLVEQANTAVATVASYTQQVAQTAQANDQILAGETARLDQAQADQYVQGNTLTQYVANQMSAQMDLNMQIIMQTVMETAAELNKYTRQVDRNANLRDAQQAALLFQTITSVNQRLDSLSSLARQTQGVVLQMGTALNEAIKLDLYTGYLPRDYWRLVDLAEDRNLTVAAVYKGNRPADLRTNYTFIGNRVIILQYIGISNSNPTVAPRPCPLPANINAVRDSMNEGFLDVVLPSVQVPRSIDRTYLRYGEIVIMAVANTSRPDENTHYRYVTYSDCPETETPLCGPCSGFPLCLTDYMSLAVKLNLTYNPIEPNSSYVNFQGGHIISLPASSTSGAIGRVISISNSSMCMRSSGVVTNDTTTFRANFGDFRFVQTDVVRYTSSLKLSMDWFLPEGMKVSFGDDRCLTASDNSSNIAYVFLLPQLGWNGNSPVGRSLPHSPRVDRNGVEHLKVNLPPLASKPKAAPRHVQSRGVATRAAPTTCPRVWDYTNSTTKPGNLANVTACLAVDGCIMQYPQRQSFALIGHISDWNSAFRLGTVDLYPRDMLAGDVTALASFGGGTYISDTLSELLSSKRTLNLLNSARFAKFAGGSMSPASFLLLRHSLTADLLENRGPNPIVYATKGDPSYLFVGVPYGTQLVVRQQAGNIENMGADYTARGPGPANYLTERVSADSGTPNLNYKMGSWRYGNDGAGWMCPYENAGISGFNGLVSRLYNLSSSGPICTSTLSPSTPGAIDHSGRVTSEVRLRGVPSQKVTYYRLRMDGPWLKRCCIKQGENLPAPCNDVNMHRFTWAGWAVNQPGHDTFYPNGNPSSDPRCGTNSCLDNVFNAAAFNFALQRYCLDNPGDSNPQLHFGNMYPNIGLTTNSVANNPSNVYPNVQIFQVPGTIEFYVEPDPLAEQHTYAGSCINTPGGAANTAAYFEQNCRVPVPLLNVEYCTGPACGQNLTRYYDLAHSDIATDPALATSPARGYQAAAWRGKNYIAVVQGNENCHITASGCGRTTTVTSNTASTVQVNIRLGYKETGSGINVFSALADSTIDSSRGVVVNPAVKDSLFMCAVECHDLTAPADCESAVGDTCTWRYFTHLKKNLCMKYNFDLATSCATLTPRACGLPQYSQFCTLTAGVCGQNAQFAHITTETATPLRYLGDCRRIGAMNSGNSALLFDTNTGGRTQYSATTLPYTWFAVGRIDENYTVTSATNFIPDVLQSYRTCAWDRATWRTVDMDYIWWNNVKQWVPCHMRFENWPTNEFQCIWDASLLSIFSTPSPGGYSPASYPVPHCMFYKADATTPGVCQYAYAYNPKNKILYTGAALGDPPVVQTITYPWKCYAPGAHCNVEDSGRFPADSTGSSRVKFLRFYGKNYGGAATVDLGTDKDAPSAAESRRPCSDYNADLTGCTEKNYNELLTPPQRCEVYLGKCIKACALFSEIVVDDVVVQEADGEGCINNDNGRCLFSTVDRQCIDLTATYNIKASRAANGSLVHISSSCFLHFFDEESCVNSSVCTWIQFNSSYTDKLSYCEQSALVTLAACIDEFTGERLRYCEALDGLVSTFVGAQLNTGCSPYNRIAQGDGLSLVECMDTVDTLATTNSSDPVYCVYLYTAAGRAGACTAPDDPSCTITQCYSSLDPDYLKIRQSYPGSSINVMYRSLYLTQFATSYTVYEQVTMRYLVDNIFKADFTLDMGNMKAQGVVLQPVDAPNSVNAFFPCPAEVGQSVVNSGGICCSVADYEAGSKTCKGPSRAHNLQHPDQVFKTVFADYCESHAEPSLSVNETVRYVNTTVNIFYLMRILPQPEDEGYALDSMNCPVLLSDENSTETAKIGEASVYAFIELEVAQRLRLSSRIASGGAECIIDYPFGGKVIRLIRLSSSTITAASAYFRFPLYDGTPFFVTEVSSDVYGSFNARGVDFTPQDMADLAWPGIGGLMATDVFAQLNTLTTQHGPDPSQFFRTIGRGLEVLQYGGTESEDDITVKQWRVKVPVYLDVWQNVEWVVNYRQTCDITVTVTDVESEDAVTYSNPVYCDTVNDYTNMLMRNYDPFMHFVHNGKLFVVPPEAIDISSPRAAREGKISCFSAGRPDARVTFAEALAENPTLGAGCFTNSPMAYTVTARADVDWREDWCGSIAGDFSESDEITQMLGLALLRLWDAYANEDGVQLAQQWLDEIEARGLTRAELFAFYGALRALWLANGCTKPLVNHVEPEDVTMLRFDNGTANVTSVYAKDLFWKLHEARLEAELANFNSSVYIPAIFEEFLLPLIEAGNNPYCGNCGGPFQSACLQGGTFTPIVSSVGRSNRMCALHQMVALFHDTANMKLIGVARNNADTMVASVKIPGSIDITEVNIVACPTTVTANGTELPYYTAPTAELKQARFVVFNPTPYNIVLNLEVFSPNCSGVDVITIGPGQKGEPIAYLCLGDFEIRIWSSDYTQLCFNSTGTLVEMAVATSLGDIPDADAYILSRVNSSLLTALTALNTQIQNYVISQIDAMLVDQNSSVYTPIYASINNLTARFIQFETTFIGANENASLLYQLPELIAQQEVRLSEFTTNISFITTQINSVSEQAGTLQTNLDEFIVLQENQTVQYNTQLVAVINREAAIRAQVDRTRVTTAAAFGALAQAGFTTLSAQSPRDLATVQAAVAGVAPIVLAAVALAISIAVGGAMVGYVRPAVQRMRLQQLRDKQHHHHHHHDDKEEPSVPPPYAGPSQAYAPQPYAPPQPVYSQPLFAQQPVYLPPMAPPPPPPAPPAGPPPTPYLPPLRSSSYAVTGVSFPAPAPRPLVARTSAPRAAPVPTPAPPPERVLLPHRSESLAPIDGGHHHGGHGHHHGKKHH